MKLKKILFATLASVILIIISVTTINAKAVCKYCITDVTCIQKAITNIVQPTQADLYKFDYNGNGELDITDATYLQKIIVELADNIPSEVKFKDTDVQIIAGSKYQLNVLSDKPNSKLKYLSDNNDIAKVDNNGNITGVKSGKAVITVLSENGITDTCTITVVSAPKSIKLNKTEITLGASERYSNFTATDSDGTYISDLKWFSTNENIAKVINGKNGYYTIAADSIGTVTLTAETCNGLTATCVVTVKQMATSLTLNETNLTLGVGETFDLNSYVPANTAAYVRDYSVDNSVIASVEKAGGLVTAKTAGTTTVHCVLQNGVYTDCVVTVKSAPSDITLSDRNITRKVGQEYTISAQTDTGTYSLGNTWSSSNTSVVSITKINAYKAKLVPKLQGTATITVKTYNGKTASCKVTVSGSVVKCIDVSTWQSDIDFNKVKADGINYVIIRAGYGELSSQKDNQFEANYKKAKAAGLKIGVYWFSYATTVSGAQKEAQACLACLGNKQIDMPVYYDLEYEPALNLGKPTLTNMAITFCDAVKAGGYRAGTYSGGSAYTWLLDYKKIADKGYSIWDAEWNDIGYTIDCDIWQYTSVMRVNGISTVVDCNYIYNLNIVK